VVNGHPVPEPHSGIALNDSLWHFVVGTASTQAAVIRFYLDGEMTMELPFEGPITPNEGDLFIGRHYLLGRYFSGVIDEVKVYDGALTSDEVCVHYHSPCFTCGDCNGDLIIDVGDVVCIVNYLFKSGDPPEPEESIDLNLDDTIDLGDAVYLINYLFKDGPPPCCP
jgi:hypothetical protein